MNEQIKIKQNRSGNRSGVTAWEQASEPRFRQLPSQTKRVSPKAGTITDATRRLMICLGWLRLFQKVALPHQVGRRVDY